MSRKIYGRPIATPINPNKFGSGGDVDQGGLSDTASALLITILRAGVYNSDQSANIKALADELGVTEPEATLSSISATYSGGDVTVGTAVNDLASIVVTATYSDGSTETVTGYTLSGEIVEGDNIITVTYQGKTATFTVTGVAAEDSAELMCEDNIVVAGHYIGKSADYSFYTISAKAASNVYEIPVVAGVTYNVSITNKNQYGVPNYVEETLGGITAKKDMAVSATKLPDLTKLDGSRVTHSFDSNGTVNGNIVQVKNDDGTYTRTVTFTPAISGYLYTSNRYASDTISYSIKKAVT